MKNKRRLYKKKSKIFSILENHINQNIKEYAISLLIFFIGIIIGVVLVNSSTAENKENITGYINEFIGAIKNKEYSIDGNKLLIKSIVSNFKLAVIIWVAGSTIIGIPIIYASVGYKGVCVGYTVSAIIATLGKSKGIIFSISTLLLQNIVAIPCILALTVSSIKMYKNVMKERNKENIKAEICRHTLFSLIMTIGLIISSFLEYFFTTVFFCDIIINFM